MYRQYLTMLCLSMASFERAETCGREHASNWRTCFVVFGSKAIVSSCKGCTTDGFTQAFVLRDHHGDEIRLPLSLIIQHPIGRRSDQAP